MLTAQRVQVVALTFRIHEILSELQSSPPNGPISESTVRMLLQDEVAFRHIIVEAHLNTLNHPHCKVPTWEH